MGVMAKLLALHKLNPVLFNKLNEWNANFDTENEQFKRMRQSLDDDNPIQNLQSGINHELKIG